MRLTRIDVESLPGVGGPFALEPGSGVNLVLGPNTSGKSSLARAVQGLLWPSSSPAAAREFLAAELTDVAGGGGTCRVGRHGDGVLTWTRDGAAMPPPRLPDGHLRSRYDLGLLPLVEPRSDGRDRAFAAEVRRQMTGGYDLDVTGGALFRASPAQAGRRLKEWRQAQLERSEHERRHRDLRERERGLDGWRAELDAAEAQAQLADRLRAALAVDEARAVLAAARERLDTFPPVLAAFRDDDPQSLQALRQAAAAAATEVAACERRLAEAREQRAALGPAPGPAAPYLPDVDVLVEAWRVAAGTLESAAVMTAGLRSQRDDAALKLAGGAAGLDGGAGRTGPDREALGQLASLFVDAEAARARLEAAESLLSERLLAEAGPVAPDAANLNDTAAAVAALEAWLARPRPSPWWPLAAAAAGIVLVAGSMIARAGRAAPLALAVGAFLFVAGGAGTARAVWASRQRRRRTAATRRALAAVGLAEAERAVADADVPAAAAARDRHHRADARRELVAGWRDRLVAERDRAAARLRELEGEAARLRRDCGLGSALDGRGVLHDADAAARLREAEGALARAVAEQAKRAENEAERAARVREALVAAGEPEPLDPAAAAATVRRRQQRLDDQARADRELALAGERLREAGVRRDAAEAELARLRGRLELAADGGDRGDEEGIAMLAASHAAWREAVVAHDGAQAALAARLAGVPADLLDLTRDEVATRLVAAEDAPERARDLLQRITVLETELRAARESRGLEQALARQDQARERLADERAAARRVALADWLLEDLRRQAAASLRPAVLEHAGALLRGFTQGRHRLEVSGAAGDEPAFVAIDELSGRRQSLAELSDGTRVQLLLAVRLAFITAMEDGEPLPLFLDESLTTTDPARFAAVAGALGELARAQNRQVFYLTSQPGDVGAWNAALAARGLPPAHVIDLAATRRLDGAATPQQLAPAAPPQPVARPDGDDDAALARWRLAVGVPPLAPFAPASAQHIDWLLLDPARLECVLLDAGASHVGPLLAALDDFVDFGVLDAGTAAMLRSRARALAAFLAHWRVGRGRPVTVEDVDDSGAVSARMRAPVLDLLRNVDGDARAFASRLVDVNRLQERVAERLVAHLRDCGALDERPTLDVETVVARVLGDLGRAQAQPAPAAADVRGWVLRWWEAARGPVRPG